MSDVLAIGESDLATVACSVVVDLLSGIEIDGKSFPPLLSQVYPTDAGDLPCICVTAPGESYTIGSGRRQRIQRNDMALRVTLVMSAPKVHQHRMEILAGKVRSEIKSRLAANRTLKVDGQVLAQDVTLQRIDKGFATTGTLTVMVSQMAYAAVIHSVEGDDTAVLQSY